MSTNSFRFEFSPGIITKIDNYLDYHRMIRLIFNHLRSIRFLIKKQRAKELYSISGLINPLTAHINDNFYVNTECEEYFSKYFDEQQPYSKSSMILKYFVFLDLLC